MGGGGGGGEEEKKNDASVVRIGGEGEDKNKTNKV